MFSMCLLFVCSYEKRLHFIYVLLSNSKFHDSRMHTVPAGLVVLFCRVFIVYMVVGRSRVYL